MSILPFRAAESAPAGSAGAAPTSAAPTIGSVIDGYLGHLSLKLQLGQLTAAHHANVVRALRSFADAWRVVYADGRQALVPAKRCGTPAEALACAMSALGMPSGQPPTALYNRDWPLPRCSSDDLTRWVIANPQWKTGWSKTNNLVAIVAAFSWHEEETGVRSPYRRGRMPKFEKTSRREADAREYVALMRHTSTVALRRILWALWNLQGIRTCEARELLWSDFRWDAGCLVIDRHKGRRRSGKPKLIGLTPRQHRFFAALRRQAPPGTTHVFLNTEGEPWNRRSLARHLRATAQRIGLDDGVEVRISAYCFRHSYATQAEEAGIDDRKTAMLMGHSSPEMVRRVYSKIERKAEPLRKAAIEAEAARRQARRANRKPRGKQPRCDQPELFD